jgi:hypothetical protein
MASTINAITTGAGGIVATADTSGILQLQTAGTTAVTIDTSQNVGIGTTSPSGVGKVAVVQSGQSTTAYFSNTNASWASDVVNSYSPSGTETSQISLSARSDGTSWLTSAYGAVLFRTGTAGSASEAMRIAATGVVLIGSASVFSGANSKLSALWDPSSQNGFTLKASGTTFSNYAIAFRTSSDTTSGYISQAASTVTYSTSSDYRLKENIVPMTGALNKVALLKPVTYTWKIDNSAGQGFIAHELQEVVPEAVCGEKDAVDEEGNIKPQGVDTSFLVATLTAAIQELAKASSEQQALITSLTARITALEAK